MRDETSGYGESEDVVAEQAAHWVAQHDLGTIDPSAFAAWRDADVRHAIAFNRALSVTEEFDRNSVTSIHAVEQKTPRPLPSRRSALRTAGGGFAVALLAASGLAGRAYAWSRVSTPIGENRKLRLPDGSIAALNTDSCLSWRFSRHERSLWVERGEVAIDLCPGVTATMHGEGQTVTLAPGRFNARLRGDTLDLLVLRGQAWAGDHMVKPRQSLLLSAGASLVRTASPSQMKTAIAWQQGEILFDEATLGTAVEEYNRFLVRKIVIVDPDLATIPIGGRFTSNDPSVFLQAITKGLGVHVSQSDTAYLLTR